MSGAKQNAVKRFRNLRSTLSERFPKEAKQAKKLAAKVVDPRTASAERIWQVMWDKPLYANTQVSIAHGWIDAIRDLMKEAWKGMLDAEGSYAIEHAGGYKKASFKVRGTRARKIIEQGHIAPHRLFAIVNAGRALAVRAEKNSHPFADLPKYPISEMVNNLKRELGFGWGQATILHFLTDLGLAVKPDLHLVRALKELGLWPKSKAKHPSMTDAIQINEVVRSLTKEVMGDLSPQSLREIDKTLMEISKTGLV